MIEEYYFFKSNESFDYLGPFGSQTHTYYEEHGFTIELDKNYNVDISTLEATGIYSDEMEKIKTLEELKNYLVEHLKEVALSIDEENNIIPSTPKFKFDELIEWLDEQIKEKNKELKPWNKEILSAN